MSLNIGGGLCLTKPTCCTIAPIVAQLNDVTYVWLCAIVQLAGLIRPKQPPTFSDTADHKPSPWYTFFKLRACWMPIFGKIYWSWVSNWGVLLDRPTHKTIGQATHSAPSEAVWSVSIHFARPACQITQGHYGTYPSWGTSHHILCYTSYTEGQSKRTGNW